MARRRSYNWHAGDGALRIRASAALYPREPLFAACCVYIDDYYVGVDLSGDKKSYIVSLIPKDGKPLKNAAALAGDFQNELLNNVLRYQIAGRNHKVREAIVTEALFFSKPRAVQTKACRDLAQAEQNCPR